MWNDGALILTFQGPKDDKGNAVTPDNAPTVLQIDAMGNVDVTTNAQQELKIDRVAKQILFTNGETSITMTQDGAKISTKSTELDIETTKDCNIKVGGKANINVTDKCILQASEINLNGSMGDILTTKTSPIIDAIYGQPTVGVPTVKAG